MNCDSCQSENASVYLSNVGDGEIQKVNLCASCAEQHGVNDPKGYDLVKLLKDVATTSKTGSAVTSSGLRCEHCGFTQADFKKTGRFGCSRCYRVFSDGLDNLLEAMHRNTIHGGKVPRHFSGGTQLVESRLDALQTDLEASVDAEDYEEAARLRDAITELESKIAGGDVEAGTDPAAEN